MIQGAVYTDFHSLQELGAMAGKKPAEQLTAAAEQFSAVFTHMMLKTMREAELGEGIFDSQQSDFYRDMFDQQIALHLSGRDGLGFTGLIVDALSAYTTTQDLPTSADTETKDAQTKNG